MSHVETQEAQLEIEGKDVTTRDGRNIDPEAGALLGEGSQQKVKAREIDTAYPGDGIVHQVPSQATDRATPDYYGLPMLKETVWTWMIPTYFFLGGLSGASSALGSALQLTGHPERKQLERRLRYVGAAGDNISAVLLIADLGRPTRFLNMLRVVRPSSPMSVGSWILVASGGFNTLAALLANRKGALKLVGDVASFMGGVLGVPLAGYTGVLLANTAVPVWQGAHRTLPVLFMSSGVATAGALMDLMPGKTPEEARTVRIYGIAGRVAELATSFALDREVGRHARVAEPLTSGVTGAVWKAAKVLTASSLALALLGRRRRALQVLSGALGLAGGVALRWSIFQAGKRSARDPQASFQGQRAGLGGAEVSGRLPALGPSSPERTLVGGARAFKLPVLR